VKKKHNIVTRAARESAAVIEQFCQANGQMLLPIVNLIQSASQVVETVIHELGHQTLEVILMLSAEQVAGARTPGKVSSSAHELSVSGQKRGFPDQRFQKVSSEISAAKGSENPGSPTSLSIRRLGLAHARSPAGGLPRRGATGPASIEHEFYVPMMPIAGGSCLPVQRVSAALLIATYA
jgi:hypothetical protein